MKHIFTIHSPLTFLVAYSIIRHLGLESKEVILITHKYKIPLEDYTSYPSFARTHQGFWKKLTAFNVPRHYDRYVAQITEGEPFVAYVDLMSYQQRILVTHKDCVEFHFMEEGNSAYQEYDDLEDITWHERQMGFRNSGLDFTSLMRVLRGYNLRLLGMPYIYSAYSNMEGIRYYAFSKNAFYNLSEGKRVLVKPDKDDPNMLKLAGNFALEDEVVWLDGSNSRYTGLDEEVYYDAIEKAIPILKQKGIIRKKVYAKLRPGIKNYDENELIRILKKNNLEIEVMPNDMVLESFLICSRNCQVIGTLTAALEYAHVFGHKAFSIYGLFENQPPTFFDRMSGFWQNVQKLKV